MSRKLKIPAHEVDPKCNTSIRASSTAVSYLQVVRQAIIAHMATNPQQQTPLFPNDVNSDMVIRLLCRMFARDFGVELEEGVMQ